MKNQLQVGSRVTVSKEHRPRKRGRVPVATIIAIAGDNAEVTWEKTRDVETIPLYALEFYAGMTYASRSGRPANDDQTPRSVPLHGPVSTRSAPISERVPSSRRGMSLPPSSRRFEDDIPPTLSPSEIVRVVRKIVS